MRELDFTLYFPPVLSALVKKNKVLLSTCLLNEEHPVNEFPIYSRLQN